MSVFTQGNILQTFVVNNTKLGANPSIPAVGADLLATLKDSQVVAVGKPVGGSSEQVIQANSSAGTYDYFRLVQETKDSSGVTLLNYGPIIKLSNTITTTAATKTYSAAQEQIWYIGYNSTGASGSGDLDVSAGNEFMLTIAYDHDDILWSEQKLRNTYDYYSAAPTKLGLAQSMTSQINYKENLGRINGTGIMVRANIVTDGGTTGTDRGNTWVANLDSPVITKSAHGMTPAAGDVIKVGTYWYTVSSYTANTITLSTNFQEANTTSAQVYSGQTITKYGIEVKGQALTFVRDFFKYNKVKFHFDLKGFGTAAITKTQESLKGVGGWQEAAEYESFSMGNEGALNRMVIPIPPVRGYVDTSGSTNYDVTTMTGTDYSFTGNSSIITGNTPMRIQQFVFFPTSSYGLVNRNQLGQQLNNLLGASL